MKVEKLNLEKYQDMPMDWHAQVQQARLDRADRAILITLHEGLSQDNWSEEAALSFATSYLQYNHDSFTAAANKAKSIKDEDGYTTASLVMDETATVFSGMKEGKFQDLKSTLLEHAELFRNLSLRSITSFDKERFSSYVRVLEAVHEAIPDTGSPLQEQVIPSWLDKKLVDEDEGECAYEPQYFDLRHDPRD